MSARVARICLVIVGLGVGAVLGEGFARVLQPHARDPVIPRLFVTDDELGWGMQRNGIFRHRTQYFDTTYTTNSHSLFGLNHPFTLSSFTYIFLAHKEP